ncbi:dihydrofolate reductase family protein [Bailinhaonella thermotolerans]|uniref:Deaminase n=1 Tax=Bailinhaonella thermotolerans TaxID=1070861 RepID=A0A3A4BVL8_9ACTN|nr:dihydrofolate reductase family protein [Bailinhaonella thermotolerans]RJL35648.1 deaminase [Bailinhaonella thermotolerans]
MGKLIYSMITSLDGYVADERGDFAWGEPDEEAHRYVNELTRSVGTYLYGRRMYETMVYWETADTLPGQPPYVLDWARQWQAADKIVYSTTLDSVSSARTRLEREFDPAAVRRLKETAGHDLTVDGPGLAAHAIRAGLVDEYHQFLAPVVVGGGTRFFPDHVRLNLETVGIRQFANGWLHLRHRPKP